MPKRAASLAVRPVIAAVRSNTRTIEVPNTGAIGIDRPVAACSPANRPARFAGPARAIRWG